MKRRILLWLCPIVILFLGVGLYAVLLFNRLGGSIDVILRENYESVLAGQQMKESSERMDSGLSFAATGEERRGRDLFNENVPLFQESLKKELNNITLPGEGELAKTEITFSAFPDAILALSLDGKINFANPAAGKLLQKLNGEYGLPLAIEEEVGKVLKGAPDSVPTSFEKAIPVRIDDHEAFLLPRVIGMRDESGNMFGAALVLQDVTRFRLMDELKTNLVSTVSHERKTPLTSIRMGLHLLLEERIGPLNPKQLELLVAAREDSERLLRIINDLLDLARLESGRTRQRLGIVSPRTLIDDALPNLQSLAEAYDLRLVVEVAPDLPEVAVDSRQITE